MFDFRLVNVYRTMENHHAIYGYINYFYGPLSIAMLNYRRVAQT